MTKYKVTYHFGNEFNVSRFIEETDRDMALNSALPSNGSLVEFEDSKGVFFRFDMKDVVLTSINEHRLPQAIAKPF